MMDIELIDIVHAIRMGTDEERDMLRQALNQLYHLQAKRIERLGAYAHLKRQQSLRATWEKEENDGG